MSENVSNDGRAADLSGRRYTHGHEQATLASHGRRTAADSAAYLLPHLRPGLDVLDVGCGPGSITLDLAEVVGPGRVVGLENVEAPLVTARASAAERGDTTTDFVTGDAYALPYEADSFDVVHAHQVLQHLTDPVAALAEMVRVCRPGGVVAVRDADYAAMAWYPAEPGLDDWREVYRAVARANGAQPDAARHLRGWVNALDLPEGARVEVGGSAWTYADPATCRWWGTSQATRYTAPVFASQAAALGVSEERVAAMGEAWRRWGEHPDAWFLILHGEALVHLPQP